MAAVYPAGPEPMTMTSWIGVLSVIRAFLA